MCGVCTCLSRLTCAHTYTHCACIHTIVVKGWPLGWPVGSLLAWVAERPLRAATPEYQTTNMTTNERGVLLLAQTWHVKYDRGKSPHARRPAALLVLHATAVIDTIVDTVKCTLTCSYHHASTYPISSPSRVSNLQCSIYPPAASGGRSGGRRGTGAPSRLQLYRREYSTVTRVHTQLACAVCAVGILYSCRDRD